MFKLVTPQSALEQQHNCLVQIIKTQRVAYQQDRSLLIKEIEASDERRKIESNRYERKIASMKALLVDFDKTLEEYGIVKDLVDENNTLNEEAVDFRNR